MLIVDRVNGTPNFSAARAAAISPSGCCMPVRPTGASATGIATSRPIICVFTERSSMLRATRCLILMRPNASELSRYVDWVQAPESA